MVFRFQIIQVWIGRGAWQLQLFVRSDAKRDFNYRIASWGLCCPCNNLFTLVIRLTEV
jgi:hypothetical protein